MNPKHLFFFTLLTVFITLSSVSAADTIAPAERYRIDVALDTANHRISGSAELTILFSERNSVGFLLNKDFEIKGASIGDKPVELIRCDEFDPADISVNYGTFGRWEPSQASLWTVKDFPKQAVIDGTFIIKIDYSGSLYTPLDDRQFSRERIAFEVNGTIGSEGIYLSPSAFWYPRTPDHTATHVVTARIPKGWNCVTDGMPGDPVETGEYTSVTHTANNPTNGLNFSAGPYVVKTIDHNGVMVATYMLPLQVDLADGYLEACGRFIDMYRELIAPYPFGKFAVVDNFLPSGYGMPGWTLLGSEVLRLPFIKHISLGHEILHNWFGNSLLVDYRSGNWCEGITVYFADYMYKEHQSDEAAKDYRMNVLRDYVNYVSPENDYPVCEFSERSDPHDRAIGYGKAMMIFHMLQQLMAESDPNLFIKVISDTYIYNKWKSISWRDWQSAFESAYGRDLGWFFNQWVNRVGAPEISIHDVHASNSENGWTTRLTVQSKPDENPYRYLLPIRSVCSDGSIINQNVFVSEPIQEIELNSDEALTSISLDPDFNVFRKLYPSEMPLTLSAFFGDPNGVLIIPSQGEHAKAFREAAEGLKTEGQRVVTDVDFHADEAAGSLWIFGGPNNRVWQKYPGMEHCSSAEFELDGEIHDQPNVSATFVKEYQKTSSEDYSPVNIVHTITLSGADPVAGTRKLTHYGKYSYLAFDGDKNIRKGMWLPAGNSPMNWTMKP